MAGPFKPELLKDALGAFPEGVDNGLAPLLLKKTQLAKALNATVRGQFITHRPVWRKLPLKYDGLFSAGFSIGTYQGGAVFNPDNDLDSLILSIGGRLFKIAIDQNEGQVSDITIAGDANPSIQPQAWLWQAEKWMIVNDGVSKPLFYDNSSAVRSNYNTPTNFSDTVATGIAMVAVGANITIVMTAPGSMIVGDLVTLKNYGTLIVQDVSGSPNIVFANVNILPGKFVTAGTLASWTHLGTQLPPGRMGAYVMGRNWFSLTDARRFMASDIAGGSSGTVANQYRDSVLSITENNYLAGGGFFMVPGPIGSIRAIREAATLDASLGQGPVQIFTPKLAFSCNSPTDRLTWQDITNPILTESAIGGGALGQYSTINANSDILSRALDSIRSMKFTRNEFQTWGRTPISFEVDSQLATDDPGLLQYSSAIIFQNRMLMTTAPASIQQGVIHRALIPLNFDPVSSLRGKAPSVYDSLIWTGPQIFQVFVGDFSEVERAFAFTWNDLSQQAELWELLPDGNGRTDPQQTRVVWSAESAALFRYPDDHPLRHTFKRLTEGSELQIDELEGTVDFQVYYKPDQWPCWVPWASWQECQTQPVHGAAPGFRSRIPLPEPDTTVCDPDNDRPLSIGKTFQVRVVVTGKVRIVGMDLAAITVPEPKAGKPVCTPLCPAQ